MAGEAGKAPKPSTTENVDGQRENVDRQRMRSTPPCISKTGSQTPVGIYVSCDHLPLRVKRAFFVKSKPSPRVGRHFGLIAAKPRL